MRVVVDTNILMELNFNFSDYKTVCIPIVVLEELDHLKTNKDYARAHQAKVAIRKIRDAENKIIKIEHAASTSINFGCSSMDNKILDFVADAISTGECDFFLTNDINMQIKAEAVNIPVINLLENNCDIYKGYKEIIMDDNELAEFYQEKTNDFNLNINEYLIIKNKKDEVVDKFRWTETKGFVNIYKKNFDSTALGRFKPRDIYQECAVDSLASTQFTVLTGEAGTAKTLLSLSYIMQELQNGNRNCCKIIVFSAPLKNTATIGFLPGNKNEKLLGSGIGGILASKMGGMMIVEQLISQGKIMLIPACDIRGIEIGQYDILYSTESQNADIYTMQTALQRAEDGCKVIIEGDFETQVDMKNCEGSSNGMTRAIEIFKGKKEFSTIRLENNYRGAISNIAQMM